MEKKCRIKMDDISYLSFDGKSYGLTTSKDRACLFNTKKAAENTMKSGLPPLLRHYKTTAQVEDVVIIDEKPCDIGKEAEQALRPAYNKVDVDDLKILIGEIEDRFEKIRGNKEYYNQALSSIDQEISDIVHFIEFNKFSASEGYKLAKMIQDCRHRRRKIKNQMKIVEIASSHSVMSLFKGTTSQAIDNIQNQQYTPRVLTELFDKRTMSFK